MSAPSQKLAHLFVQCRCLGDKIGFHCHIGNFKVLERAAAVLSIIDALVHRTQKVLGVDDTNDIFGIIAINRQARVVGLEDLLQNLGRFNSSVDHFNTRAMQHDFLDHAFTQIKGT